MFLDSLSGLVRVAVLGALREVAAWSGRAD